MAEVIRVNVLYSGTVQGVGFRHSVWTIAQDFAVTGWVRNLRVDRRVELLAEGSAADIDAFLEKIALERRGFIQSAYRSNCQAKGEFSSFEIAPTA